MPDDSAHAGDELMDEIGATAPPLPSPLKSSLFARVVGVVTWLPRTVVAAIARRRPQVAATSVARRTATRRTAVESCEFGWQVTIAMAVLGCLGFGFWIYVQTK